MRETFVTIDLYSGSHASRYRTPIERSRSDFFQDRFAADQFILIPVARKFSNRRFAGPNYRLCTTLFSTPCQYVTFVGEHLDNSCEKVLSDTPAQFLPSSVFPGRSDPVEMLRPFEN